MERAIKFLEQNGIESFEQAGILVVPVSSVVEMYKMISTVKSLLKECGYEKSWRIDPYYYENKSKEIADFKNIFNE